MNLFAAPVTAQQYTRHVEYPSFKMRYVGFLTLALNYRLHGLEVAGYHIFNLVLHIVNALLVYWFFSLTFNTPYLREEKFCEGNNQLQFVVPFFSAALFLVHPVQTQAVTYITQRFASLATMFYLLSICAYIKWRFLTRYSDASPHEKKRMTITGPVFYGASMIFSVLAMKTKEISFTLPLCIALYEYFFFEGQARKRLVYLIPFILTMFIIPVGLMGADITAGGLIAAVNEATVSLPAISRHDYLLTEFRVIVTYIRLLFFPLNQNLDYDYTIYYSFYHPAVMLSCLILVAMLSSALYFLYVSRYATRLLRLIAFGIFWFLITISVESSVIPTRDVIFEHRLYLPTIGAFVAMTTAFFSIWYKHNTRQRSVGNEFVALFSIILVLFCVITYERNAVWLDEISLWQDVIRKSPNKARGFNTLGATFANKQDFDTAIGLFEKAITIAPDESQAYNNLALIYFLKGDRDKAFNLYTKAIAGTPKISSAYNNRGVINYSRGNFADAIEDYDKAIEIDPNYSDALFNRGNLFLSMGLYTEALRDFTATIIMSPDQSKAYLKRGRTYLSEGIIDNAISDFRQACLMGSDEGCTELRRVLNYNGDN
ncbi:MAG: tetratricopeptide repeat protein [Nitrospirae bacterium]|nr:tetratricopeptide repeat protein [Nitrospirota bacterium]